MPELIEPLIANRTALLRIHVARAAARAVGEESDAAIRAGLLQKSTDAYRACIRAAVDVVDKEGEPGRFRLAQWRVELGDLLLRRVVGPDIDQFEISSGLSFDRAHALAVLEETAALYASAGEILDNMDIRSRIDNDETYLLHGLAGKIGPMRQRKVLNGAWCAVYRAMLSEPGTPKRGHWIADARTSFEDVMMDAGDPAIRYNAQLGFGIAQRESKRFDEAIDQFARIVQSTQPQPTRSQTPLGPEEGDDGDDDAGEYEKGGCWVDHGAGVW